MSDTATVQVRVTGFTREHADLSGLFRLGWALCSRDKGEPVPKPVWRGERAKLWLSRTLTLVANSARFLR